LRPTHNGSPPLAAGEAGVALSPATTRAEALAGLRRVFRERGLDTPDMDARVLVAAALGIDAVEIAARPEIPLGAEAAERLAAYAGRRLAHEPVGRILGRREFWGLEFELSPETLEPRPDTETVVQTALSFIADRQAALRILDLGTGTGCLLVALLHQLPQTMGIGIDRSYGALIAARRNAERNGVAARSHFVASDWAAGLSGSFDLIVSNPPYIPSSDITDLAPEVRLHDPKAALDGGNDGLDAYRAILTEARSLVVPRGKLVLELGAQQEASVRGLAEAAGWQVMKAAQDLGGHVRALALEMSGS
jgi:release factor glutamine methyltransferase